MKKVIILLAILSWISSCKSIVPLPIEVMNAQPTSAYNEQKENIKQGFYFSAVGNEPEWSLKISENKIQFSSLKPNFESFNSVHIQPIQAMDANVKMYRLANDFGTATIQIIHKDCINTMSGEKLPYTVQIEMQLANNSTHFNGCGNYITDTRLHDIWVLEKLNGQSVSLTDFIKELPNLEVNSLTNQFLGYAGCNRMNGSIFYERNLLRFTNVITTRMACPGNNKESEFLKALQSTSTYVVENNRLVLSNPSGEKLVFKKVD